MGAVGAKLSTKSIEYTTQVANGSDHDIYVLVDSYRPRVERATAQVRDVAFNTPQHMLNVANLLGFTRIQPGFVVPFRPYAQLHKVVFISIFSVDDFGFYGSGVEVCDCFPMPTDYSVVVDNDNLIHPVVHGKQWIEAGTGHNHFRHPY